MVEQADVVVHEEDGCTCIQALEEAGQAGDSHYHVGVGVDIHRVEAGILKEVVQVDFQHSCKVNIHNVIFLFVQMLCIQYELFV